MVTILNCYIYEWNKRLFRSVLRATLDVYSTSGRLSMSYKGIDQNLEAPE